jgi:HTH-type transcriptional regulator/antitoxin HigA
MKAFPPGVFIRDEMYERDWSHEMMMEQTGWSSDLLQSVIDGIEPISFDIAEDLAAAFGTSPAMWCNLEAMYRLSRE